MHSQLTGTQIFFLDGSPNRRCVVVYTMFLMLGPTWATSRSKCGTRISPHVLKVGKLRDGILANLVSLTDRLH